SLRRSSSDQETFNKWLYALKSFAKPEVFGASELLEYRLFRTFSITVSDGRGLPKDLEAYCEIMLDDQRRARTSTRLKASRNSDPDTSFWRDDFEFTDLAAFTKGITINVIQVKGSKLIPFGRTCIPLRDSQECDEGWYPIMNMNGRSRSEHLGDLRLKLKYEEQFVLPLANYCDVLEIIVNFQENNVISKLAGLVTDLEGFSKNVLRILEGKGLAVVWLNSLIDEEIAEADPCE
ncbi:Ras GTPase-activating protein nGAP, partial [Lobosporangium transversale]